MPLHTAPQCHKPRVALISIFSHSARSFSNHSMPISLSFYSGFNIIRVALHIFQCQFHIWYPLSPHVVRPDKIKFLILTMTGRRLIADAISQRYFIYESAMDSALQPIVTYSNAKMRWCSVFISAEDLYISWFMPYRVSARSRADGSK